MSNWIITVRKKNEQKPTHHLFRNHGRWWIVLSLYNKETHQKARHRQNLRTADQETAIKRRDKVLQALYSKYEKEYI